MRRRAVTPPGERGVRDLVETGELYALHVEHFRRRKRSTVQDYRIIMATHLGPFFAGRPLESIDRRLVCDYQQAKLAAGLRQTTVASVTRSHAVAGASGRSNARG